MVPEITADPAYYLPDDWKGALLVGRVWLPAPMATIAGPTPVVIRPDGVFDLWPIAPTMADLLALPHAAIAVREARDLPRIGDVDALIASTFDQGASGGPYFLAPTDLQPIKACGVTFACSMIERIIEEQAAGDKARAAATRAAIVDLIGEDLSKIVPGSPAADELKAELKSRGMWSQYLEVGIGPYAEIFSKSQAMSAVGLGAEVGLNALSDWNNPEPELVLIVNPEGKIVGATLGNDVNLRDIEGRSALLLGKAKDNNASCALGPFIRLLDEQFTLDTIRRMQVDLTIEGDDGFVLQDASRLTEISRDVEDLVKQTIGPHHQYPDGFALMTGTLFAPTADRNEPGSGFTHLIGDIVRISARELGCLENRVTTSDRAKPWTFGTRALFEQLHARRTLDAGSRDTFHGVVGAVEAGR